MRNIDSTLETSFNLYSFREVRLLNGFNCESDPKLSAFNLVLDSFDYGYSQKKGPVTKPIGNERA